MVSYAYFALQYTIARLFSRSPAEVLTATPSMEPFRRSRQRNALNVAFAYGALSIYAATTGMAIL